MSVERPKYVMPNGGLLAVIDRRHTADTFYSSTSTSVVAIDTTNLRLTFTVPNSGKVIIRVGGPLESGAAYQRLNFAIMNGASVVRESAVRFQEAGTGVPGPWWVQADWRITGLAPGATISYDMAWRNMTAANWMYLSHGPTYGNILMEAWEVF